MPNAQLVAKTLHVFLAQNDIAIAVKLIDDQFPHDEQAISREHKKVITIDRLQPLRGRGRFSTRSAS